jgi:hypothetical protein
MLAASYGGGPGENQTHLSKGANLARPLGTCGPIVEFVVSRRPPSFRHILPVLTSPGRLEVRSSSGYLFATRLIRPNSLWPCGLLAFSTSALTTKLGCSDR